MRGHGLLMAAAGGGASYKDAVLADGPYGFWQLNGDLLDSSGNGRNGTQQGAAAVFGTPLACPKIPSAYINDGTKYISLSSMPLPASPWPMTAECWFTRADTSANSTGLMGLQQAATGYSSSYSPIIYIGTDGKLIGGSYSGSATTVASTALVTDGLPHHAAIVITKTSITLYLDGIKIGTIAANVVDFTATAYLILSATNNYGWPSHNTASNTLDLQIGAIAGCAYYNKVLTDAQILAHYNAGK